MNKKTTSFLRLAVCLAFVMTLLLSAAAPSLANNQMNATNALVGTEQNPANAAITKCFAMGQETQTPNITFTFQIAKVSLNGISDAAALAEMPTIGQAGGVGGTGTVTAAYTQADVYAANNPMTFRANQTDYLYKETQALFPNTVQWTRTGIYLYRITEQQTTNYFIADATRETLTLSKAQYDIQVYVAARTQGTGYYVWAIGAYPILNDAGNQTGNTVGNPAGKVNPQPGGPTGGGGVPGLGTGPYSRMIFQNDYLRHGSTNPPINPDTDHKFRIRKAIEGIGSDPSLYFNFDVTIRKPAISTKNTYKAYVYEGNSMTPLNATQLQQNVTNMTIINNAGHIEMPLTGSATIKLKANQYLAFTDIDAGATYVVNELGTIDYTPSYNIFKGNNVTPIQSQTGTQNGSLSTPVNPPIIISISPTNSFIDRVDFSNKYKDVIPTGIAVNDLPYIALVVFASLALGGYLFFRIKSHKHEEAAVESN